MTCDETQTIAIEIAHLAAAAVHTAIGGCSPGFDHDFEQVETLLAEALLKSIEEIEVADGSRRALGASLRDFLGRLS